MEHVLGIYAREPDPLRPLVCLDEFSIQLLGEVRQPVPAAQGRPAREDYEYTREGSASAFMLCMPHLGTREVYLSEDGRRRATDYADALRFLCEEMLPDAPVIDLVQDNLNTHCRASLYKRFSPEQAEAIDARLRWHYTPKHGSWLNMAEIEIGAVASRALRRRIATLGEFRRQVGAAVKSRNANPKPIQWTFTSKGARIKLATLCPLALDVADH